MTDKTSPSYWQDSSSDDESYDSPPPCDKPTFDRWLTLYADAHDEFYCVYETTGRQLYGSGFGQNPGSSYLDVMRAIYDSTVI